MTRDEYLIMLDTEPATPNQVGAVHREFARLGVVDRPERLAISAALLDLDGLDSTTHLVMGDAGRLINILQHATDRTDLPEVTVTGDGHDQADEHELTFIEVIKAAILAFIGGAD